MKDQVEILTHDKGQAETTHPRDVKKILSELPVREQQERNALLDSVAAEEEEMNSHKNHAFQDLETVLTWIGYAAAVGVALALTWAVAVNISRYL